MTLEGVDLGGSSYRLTVLDVRKPLLPAPRVSLKELAAADGAVSAGESFGPLQLTVEAVIEGATLSDVKTKCRAVAGRLARAAVAEVSVIFDCWNDRTWNVRLTTEFSPDIRGASARVTFGLVAPYPWALGVTEVEDLDNAIAGDTDFEFAVGGDRNPKPVWVIKNTGAASSAVSLYNETTGELAAWSGTLPTGAWLRFNRSDKSVEVSVDSGGTWTNVISGLSGGVPRLLGAATNTVWVYGIETGTLDVTYYAVYG